jgi:hypothetical protein
MKSYYLKRPTDTVPLYLSRIKHLKDLPEGTTLTMRTEYAGKVTGVVDIPIVSGKPQVKSSGKNTPKSAME